MKRRTIHFASIFIFFIFLNHPFTPSADLHRTKQLTSQLLSQISVQDTPTVTTDFEVTKPIRLPNTKPCSTLVLQHDFGFTFGRPPAFAYYKPPKQCKNFSKVVLEWRATSMGRQYDRIFGVWLGGAEVLRGSTAEPTATGIVWTVEKDITRYASLLKSPQTLAVYVENLVDQTYTGVYHVNLTFHFYPEKPLPQSRKLPHSRPRVGLPADLIIPISRNLPLTDGLWFTVQNSDGQLKEFSIPRNAYRAVLEVYVSFHQSDEFWYGNLPNEFIQANNLTDTPGNGPFREVVVSLDGKTVGAVYPFTVIYTGGINPLLWRPITGIGSFDLPSYDINLTPFLGSILDGKLHKIGLGVTNALNHWYIDANLHVWLDVKSVETKGELMEYVAPVPKVSSVSNFAGLNGTFLTTASRYVYASGWVESSYGKITTQDYQHFSFVNMMHLGKNGILQEVNQTIYTNHTVNSNLPSIPTGKLSRNFHLYLYNDDVDEGTNAFTRIAKVSLGFDEDRVLGDLHFDFLTSSLRNAQDGQAAIHVKANLVTSVVVSTQQAYKYDDNTGDCFFRNVSASNQAVLYDNSVKLCSGNH